MTPVLIKLRNASGKVGANGRSPLHHFHHMYIESIAAQCFQLPLTNVKQREW